MWGCEEKTLTQKRGFTQPCGHPNLRLLASQTVRNRFLLFVSCPVCSILLYQPKGTDSIIVGMRWFSFVLMLFATQSKPETEETSVLGFSQTAWVQLLPLPPSSFIAKLCPTLWRPHGLYSTPAPLSVEFLRQEFPSPGYLLDPGIGPIACFGKQTLYYWATRKAHHLLVLWPVKHRTAGSQWSCSC